MLNQYCVTILLIIFELFLIVIGGGSLLFCPSLSHNVGRIANGIDTHIKEHPYMVQLEIEKKVCGGSILTPMVILTAGHCILDNSNIYVRAGATDKGIGGSKIRVQTIEIHPKYKLVDFVPSFDVAILKLEEPLQFSNTIQSICLATEGDRAAAKNVGMVAGWGWTHFWRPTSLQYAFIPIIPEKQCQLMYSKADHNHTIDSSMFCALNSSGQDSCQGDSGGPLTVNFKLYGVISWGELPCGNPNYPGVYAKLTHLDIRKWIITTVNKFSNNSNEETY